MHVVRREIPCVCLSRGWLECSVGKCTRGHEKLVHLHQTYRAECVKSFIY